MKYQLTQALLTVSLVAATGFAQAALIPSGSYYTDVIGGGLGTATQPSPWGYNDDGSYPGSILFNFATPLNFFGHSYTSFYLNNNGNISFGHNVSSFTPSPLNTTTAAPMIAPYWADLDTRPGAPANVYLRQDVANQTVVTWDQVGYYSGRTDKRVSFQLVVRGSDYVVPTDEGQIGFFFKTMGWETGDASGGSGGFGGVEATVGFGDGLAAVNDGEFLLPGSQNAGISAIVQNNHYWFNLSDTGAPQVSGVPEPASLALLGLGLAGLGFVRRKPAKPAK